ncbi:glycosyltransferase family 4 protein [Geobacter sp. FeAm09]|uniref:glycosyltransferase family 4 protein n=1 Tax=Geobacter sp. FeAm09 TaxID=2597769 RepID=UPI0011ECD582|nr:glycosyltransferase family 4 protein [Geobacter sp. FeAm09]QEM69126.1 glycosyltransferase family 4 protein [Geobacter sp. FeAm09]
MKVLLILKRASSLTGAGTYEEILVRELQKRHQVRVYESERDLEEEWDIAHCSDLKHLSPSVARKLRCPLVVDAHDYYWIRYYHFFCLDFPLRFLLQKYRRIKYHYLFRHIDAMILHGRFMYDIYDHPNKYLSFYFGLDYGEMEERAWEEREDLILFVGGDFFRKGLPRLLRALPLVLRRVPTARLRVIGRDYWYARALARFLSRGLPVEFVFGMPRADVYREYGKAKALVLPSEIEALSLVSAEATMAGVPPILADVGGMPEVVEDRKTGFIFPLADTALLAERIVTCLTDRELSERLVRSGKQFFARFTPESMMERLDEIYLDVVAKSGATGRHHSLKE